MTRRARRLAAAASLLALFVRVDARQAPLSLAGVTPSTAYNFGSTTITVSGSGFTAAPVSVTLISPAARTTLGSVTVVDDHTLTAVVPADLLEGGYDLAVSNTDGGQATLTSAFTAKSSHSGDIGPVSSSTLPSGVESTGHSLISIQNGYVYFLGATPGISSFTIVRGTVQADGSFADWQTYEGPAPVNTPPHPQATSDGHFVWVIRADGGIGGNPPPRIDWAPIDAAGAVVSSAWQGTSFPIYAYMYGFFARNGYLYVIGGAWGYGGGSAASYLRARIGSDGTPGAWETLASAGTSTGSGVAVAEPYVFTVNQQGLLRKCNYGPCPMYRSSFDRDGLLTPWVSAPWTYQSNGVDLGTAGGFLYMEGGAQRAQVFADGSLSAWVSLEGSFSPLARWGKFVYNDSGGFAEFSPFRVSAVSPAIIATSGGAVVTFTGNDFLPGSSVTVDGVAATEVTVSDFHRMTARVPAHAAGPVTVTIANLDGRTASTPLTYDGVPPVGTIQIDAGNVFTPSRSVTLTLNATDDNGTVASMSFSNDGISFTTPESFAPSKAWQLADADGTRQVYARFFDTAGNASAAVSDDILLDRRPPSGSVLINGGAVSTVTSWVLVNVSAVPATTATGVTDVSFSTDGATWGGWVAYDPSTFFNQTLAAGEGARLIYAKFRDSAGNVSAAFTDSIYVTSTAESSLSINSGAQYTNSASVTLDIGGSAGSFAMQVSNDGGFAGVPWEPYAARRSWTITSAGANVIPRIVYARFKDSNGTISPTVQDDIILDTNAPTGSVTLSPDGRALSLSASDDLSGVSHMAVSATNTFVGTAWEPYAATRAWPGGSPYVRFRDRAGNVSAVAAADGTLQTAPFGVVDAPTSLRVQGAVAFGGWALDDKGVSQVRIYRGPVTGESGQVFVGNAVFVEGARPDTAASFQTMPAATRAGWGLLVLTNMLPNGGNGAFTFYVYADDADGHTTLLGTRYVTVDNTTSTVPFGTIDTPAPGETVRGTYVNFGWALTPQPKTIPTDGSTLTVYVDGQALGHPTYNNYRSDIAGLFPGLANTNGAIGYFKLETAQLADGLHTISWTAADDSGAAEGLGSRYFNVSNATALRAAPALAAAMTLDTRGEPTACAPRYRLGRDQSTAWVPLGTPGEPKIRAAEEPIELQWCQPLQGAHLKDQPGLPVGASVDLAQGIFYWDPGPAFKGAYVIEFETPTGVALPALRVVIRE